MKTPFGSTVAAIRLAQMVEDNPKARRFVSSTLSEFNNLLMKAARGEDVKASRCLYILVRNEFIQRVDSSSTDPDVKSYLKNVLHTNYKKYKQGLEYRYDAIKRIRKSS